jgi:hypothetical protein
LFTAPNADADGLLWVKDDGHRDHEEDHHPHKRLADVVSLVRLEASCTTSQTPSEMIATGQEGLDEVCCSSPAK